MGWSIDSDRKNLSKSIERLNFSVSNVKSCSDIIHNIWWSNLGVKHKHSIFKPKRKILVTTSNFVDLNAEEYVLKEKFEQVNKIADAWICPSTKQKNIFEENGIRSYYQPFYIDLSLFKPQEKLSKSELCKKFEIPYEVIENKFVIGSFQRDSLGTDLSKPKWQKGPDLLIDILKDMPKDKYILLLVGPRRHYLIQKCKKYNIPYYYFGTETCNDDIKLNTIQIDDMPLLYHLTDIYFVTSKSEGGPKAVMESALTKTFILSTDVGLAGDFLNSDNVFSDVSGYKKRLFSILNDNPDLTKDIEEQYRCAYNILNYDAMDKRLKNIYLDIIKADND